MSVQTETKRPAAAATPAGWEQRSSGVDPPPPVAHPTDAFKLAAAKLAELKEFAAYYAATRIDAIKTSVRNLGIYAGIGIIGAVGAATVIVVAVVLLMTGIAGAFAAIFPPHLAWLGNIITGVLFLAIPVVGILIGMRMLTKTFKTSTVHKYESRQQQQREQFGRDVKDEARSAPSSGRTPGNS